MTRRSWILLTACLAWPGFADAARLDYVGNALGRPHVETLFAKPLRAASDSTALVEPLGRLVAELQNLGYLDARARAGWESTSREPALEVVVEEGQRMRWSSVVLEAPNPADSLAMTAALGLEPGAWASPAALREGIERCVSQVAARGYPYAQLTVTSFEWDGSGARLRMSGSRGPEVTVSRLRFEGLKATRASLAERSAGRLKGKPFDRAAAEAGRLRLERLGLFNQVSYEGLEGEADWSRGQLVYRVTEPRYNRLEGAIGREGQGRAVGLLRVELDNLAGTGRAAGLTWESRGGGVASFGARYAEPLLFGAPVKAEVALEQHVEDTLYTRTRGTGRVEFMLSGKDKLEANVEQERVVQEHDVVATAILTTTGLAFERDGRDAPVVPRRGTLMRLEASQTVKNETLRPEGQQRATAGSLAGRFEWHRPWGGAGAWRRAGLAAELSAAGRFSSQRVLPLFERYALGGATTLRGHDEQSLRVDRFALSRLEWRWFLGERPYVALFWDHALTGARVALDSGDRLVTRHADGVGFGLRLETAGGLVGLDYGLEPGRSPSEGKLHLRLISWF